MNNITDIRNALPLEFVIDFAWANGCDRFIINNAKDELKRLRLKNKEWAEEVYRANEFAIEQTNLYLSAVKELEVLKNKKEIINDRL